MFMVMAVVFIFKRPMSHYRGYDLENNLRKYILNQKNGDTMFIRENISRNADYSFKITKSLNELIADAVVLIEQGTIKDSYLKELVMEVLNYDD